MYLKSVPHHFVLIGMLVGLYAMSFILFTAPTPTVAQKYEEKAPAPKVQQQQVQQQPKPSFQQDRQQGLLDPGSFDPRQLHTPFDPQGAY